MRHMRIGRRPLGSSLQVCRPPATTFVAVRETLGVRRVWSVDSRKTPMSYTLGEFLYHQLTKLRCRSLLDTGEQPGMVSTTPESTLNRW